MSSHIRRLLFVGIVAGQVGCSMSWRLTGGTAVPAAEGMASTKLGDNGNTRLEVKVKHLAFPEKVNPGATTYVVWATADGGAAPTNIGALRLDKNLEGKLDTLTPFHAFLLTITPEVAGTASGPTGPVVFAARITSK